MPLVLRPVAHASLVAASLGSWAGLVGLAFGGGGGLAADGLAYLVAAGLTRLCLFGVKSRVQAFGFAAAAALLELGQAAIPGRAAGVGHWTAETAGALVGLGLARAFAHRSIRRPWA